MVRGAVDASQCRVAATSPGAPAWPVEVSATSRARRSSIAPPKNPVSST
ncbi:hypothetical protein STANM309S_06268 [Streptomyces tanashiensis]